MRTIWNKEYQRSYKAIVEDLCVDALVVGAGITGATIAYYLSLSNIKTAVIDARTIASGVTASSTAKLTYLQEDYIYEINKLYGKKKALLYLQALKYGMNDIKKIINSNSIDCDFENSKSYLFCKDKDNVNKFNVISDLLKSSEIVVKEEDNKKFSAERTISVEEAYTFNPVKYTKALIKLIDNKVYVFENSRLVSFKKKGGYYYCIVNHKVIRTRYLILACHYPYFLLPFMMPVRCTLERSNINITEVSDNLGYNAISIDKDVSSIRFYTEGNKHYKIGINDSHTICYENKVNSYDISNIDIMTPDGLPFIGKIKNNLFIATGFNAWGILYSTVSGQIISDMINEVDNIFYGLFNPKRFLSRANIIKLPIIMYSNMYGYIKGIMKKNNSYYKYDKERVIGIYVDEKRKKHKINAICPHAGCSLIFNEKEKTWDCPCHGSRFSIDGNVITGPANKKLN